MKCYREVPCTQYCHVCSFIFNFSYVTFFRAGSYFGLKRPTGFSNVVMLLLTLKLVGIAYEIHDSNKIRRNRENGVPDPVDRNGKPRYQPIIDDPSAVDIVHYSFCFIGLFTGPYFKFRTYKDWVHNDNSKDVPLMGPLMARLKVLPLIAALFLGCSYLFNANMKEEAFYQHPLWYRLGYMVPAFTIFRMRMYSAWILSECVCITAALGAYPSELKSRCGQGPTVDPAKIQLNDTKEYDFETIHNIDPYKCDFTPTFRDAMRGWNMTVQWWLKNHVFIRFPIKPLSTLVTMLVSAYWHGIYGSYYLSLLTVPIILIAEDLMMKAFRTEENKVTYDWFNWLFRMRGFEYLSIAFLVLTGAALWTYWSSIYFIGHILTFTFIAVGSLYRPKKKTKNEESTKDK
ncbi:lysophospholipid acyltransferase 7-like isoform X2 [Apostichopus japonicus]|uniref:lysophospholipid acyltransferase 7-like isoform X2 n=1 Tax=Stichopus japonicus TaxID=307972 RepID=UPI003AB3CD09